jgi:Transglutaminase-like superfamily
MMSLHNASSRRHWWIGWLAVVLASGAVHAPAHAKPVQPSEIDGLARTIAGNGSSVQRATNLLNWVNRNLEWTSTDYQTRTPEEILARGGGNCFELSRVFERLLRPSNVEYRWVAEINLQPRSAERQATAVEKVREHGNALSVFGLMHNDHRWLEVRDEAGGWVPADPAVGVIGLKPWLMMRVDLGPRPAPVVPATALTTRDMIVPIAIVAVDANGKPVEDRSAYYLIDGFGAMHEKRVSTLPHWKDWTQAVQAFSPEASAAFSGKTNLHTHADEIANLMTLYSALQQDALTSHLVPKAP